jgi:3-phosphoshikimate 1-carboxyvinyltransferase
MAGALSKPAAMTPPLRGTVRVPGDKSISHRALILAALAVGQSRIEGLNAGGDVAATIAALRAMGARIAPGGEAAWAVRGVGVGGLLQPAGPLELGNSGTSARLLMVLVASHPITADFIGDASLSRRPMGRLADPLRRVGARITADSLPLRVEGTFPLVPARHRLTIPSAQVKAALLLAALNTPGVTIVESPPSRDHLERMLPLFGVELRADGDALAISGVAELTPCDLGIPGDPSAAAFLAVAALIVPDSAIRIEGVGVNPTRTGLFDVLRLMGADIAFENERVVCNEPVGDLVVHHSSLTGVDVPAGIAPRMIDEYPILCVAAAFASGTTRMRGLAELRLKESDRLAAMAPLGARADGDDLIVAGSAGAPLPGGFSVDPGGDHRIAMAFTIAGLISREPIGVAPMTSIDTSFPGFLATLDALCSS